MTPADPPNLLTTAQAARIVGVSRTTMIRYVRKGQLVPSRVLPSGQYRWCPDDLMRQLAKLHERLNGGEG